MMGKVRTWEEVVVVGGLLRRHYGHPGRRMMKSRGEGVERDGEAEGVDNEGEGRSWVYMLGFPWEQNYQIALLSIFIYFLILNLYLFFLQIEKLLHTQTYIFSPIIVLPLS